MNRACCGTWFQSLGMYRCLKDGSFVRDFTPETNNCPNCGRAILATIAKDPPQLRTTEIKQQVLWNGQWVDIKFNDENKSFVLYDNKSILLKVINDDDFMATYRPYAKYLASKEQGSLLLRQAIEVLAHQLELTGHTKDMQSATDWLLSCERRLSQKETPE